MSGQFLVAYFLIFMLLCAGTFYWTRVHALKFAAVAMLAFITSAIYFSFENYKGWASQADWDSGQVVAVEIRRPDGGDKGAIYVWMYLDNRPKHDWFVYVPKHREPRVYELPYTQGQEKEWTNARQALKKGMLVYLQGKGEQAEGGVKSQGGKPTEKKGENEGYGDQEDYTTAPHPKLLPPDEVISKEGL